MGLIGMIKVKNLMFSTLALGKKLTKFEENQIARKIEKILMVDYSILCDTEVI